MKYLPPNTLAYFNAAPQVRTHDLSAIPTAVFGAATKKYRQTCGLKSPNEEALTFYALNHCASFVRKSFTPNEPLPPWAKEIMEQYTAVCVEQGKRMFHYIMAITVREMRHLPTVSMSADKWTYMKKHFGEPVTIFIQKMQTYENSEEGAMLRYMEHAPNVPVGQYLKALSYAFHKGPWGSSFGGPAWGVVTDAAVSLVHGITSMEMMVDTGWTLVHNGGPIFNKTDVEIYSMYVKDPLMTILDVQRSGQIPEFVLDPSVVKHTIPPLAKTAVQLIAANAPDEFRGWVDWISVDAMRPEVNRQQHPAKYTALIAKQKKDHPTMAPTMAKVPKTLHGKKVLYTGEWKVAPGEVVKVYERVTS